MMEACLVVRRERVEWEVFSRVAPGADGCLVSRLSRIVTLTLLCVAATMM